MCHVGSAIGGAALPALAFLEQQIEQQSTRARARFAEICRRKGIALLEGAQRSTSVTASWRVSRDDLDSLAYHARHADLIVMGRPGRSNGLTRSHLETSDDAVGGDGPDLGQPPWSLGRHRDETCTNSARQVRS